jgi:hypothetical protein
MPAAATSLHDPALSIATLLCWVFTASLGGYMLRGLIAHDGLRRQLSVRDGLHPGVLVGHFSLALTGLVTWVCYLITAAEPVAWLAVGLLVPGIGLGITTVTLWTPYPRSPTPVQFGPRPPGPAPAGPPPAGQAPPPGQAPPVAGQPGQPSEHPARGPLTDEMLARALADEALTRKLIDEMIASLPADAAQEKRNRPKSYPTAIIPLLHGVGALVTFALGVVTAAGMR